MGLKNLEISLKMKRKLMVMFIMFNFPVLNVRNNDHNQKQW